MNSEIENSKKPLFGIIILLIVGGILGAKYLSLFFNRDVFPGIIFGVLIAFGLGYIFSPGLRKRFSDPEIQENPERMWRGILTYFTHPINRPMMLGVLWFFVFFSSIIFIFPDLAATTKHSIDIMILGFIPTLVLFGWTGYRILKHGEGIGLFGKYYGVRVFLEGAMQLIFGWGFAILLFVYYITN